MRWLETPRRDCECHFCAAIWRIERILTDIAESLETIADELKQPTHNAVGGTITLGNPEPK